MVNLFLTSPWKPQASPSEIDLRRVHYANVVYWMGVALGAFYIGKYNLEYGVSRYNPAFVLLYSAYAFLPLLLRGGSRSAMAQPLFLGALSCFSVFLIYTAGGIHAPGLFWILAVPVTATTLYHQRGMVMGGGFALVSIAAYILLDRAGLVPGDVYAHMDFERERHLNLVTFGIYTLLTMLFYVRGEAALIRSLSESRAETENLLRVVVHDIANPISSIQLSLAVVDRISRNLPCGRSEICGDSQLEHIRIATSAANSILERIRQFSALRDGKLQLQLEPVDVVASIRNAVSLFSDKCAAKGVSVDVHVPEQAVFVKGDQVVLSLMVFANLLSNALKFSYREGRVEVAVEKMADTCRIRVRDHGVGMAPDRLAAIFNFRSGASTRGTDGERGTGYGMPLAKSYIEKMGGTIRAESWEAGAGAGTGTLFTVDLPLVSGLS